VNDHGHQVEEPRSNAWSRVPRLEMVIRLCRIVCDGVKLSSSEPSAVGLHVPVESHATQRRCTGLIG
jgi:hypothetical protein